MGHGAFGAFDISASGLTAQRRRLDAISDNIANAQTTQAANGRPFQRKQVSMAQGAAASKFEVAGKARGVRLAATSQGHLRRQRLPKEPREALEGGVIASVSQSDRTRLVYEPGHPDANKEGMVEYPDISVVQEMIEMILASRAYEANVTAIQSAKSIFQSALEI